MDGAEIVAEGEDWIVDKQSGMERHGNGLVTKQEEVRYIYKNLPMRPSITLFYSKMMIILLLLSEPMKLGSVRYS
jgi:hypothetical protein